MAKRNELLDLALPKRPPVSFDPPEHEVRIRWNKDGTHEIVGAPIRISADPVNTTSSLLKSYMDMPYKGPDPDLQGLSYGEAIIRKTMMQAAEGDRHAREQILDRILGKAVQHTHAISVQASLNDLLDQVSRETSPADQDMPRHPDAEEATILQHPDIESL
jgi:hypothetical protein